MGGMDNMTSQEKMDEIRRLSTKEQEGTLTAEEHDMLNHLRENQNQGPSGGM